MRSLVALAVRRRVAVMMTALAIAAFGIVGYNRLPLDLLPDISYPSLTVQTEFPDTAPAEVENLVTRPIEETVGVLRGLRSIHSVSRSGISEVTLEFDWGSDMDMLSMDVREKLDRLILPEEAEDPIVLRFDPSLDPILRLALGGGAGLTESRLVADRKLKQELETVPGVAAARVKGGFEEEIQIDVDQERLAALAIPLDQVQQIVGVSNVNLPGGSLQDVESQYLIRTVNEYDSVEEIARLVLRSDENGIVRLGDVADVRRGTKEREEITRVDGHESVEISVYKEGDANTVTTARAVRGRIEELRAKLPPGMTLTLLFDQSRFIERAVNEVRGAALIGGILAILILFAFLRHGRSTLIIATSIPLSVVATFVAMYRLDVSLNIMSLGGLTLGVGMLVDNSIVVLESIHRKRLEGLPLGRAAIDGTAEVGGAVAASTLTTVAVFLPIVFVEGIAGQLFGDMAITVTLSLLASLLVAITLIPMLSAIGRQRRGEPTGPEREPADTETIPMTLGWFSRAYDRFVRGALAHRARTIGVAAILFAAALWAVPRLGTELIPSISEGEFFFEVTMPEGTPLEATDRRIETMEEIVAEEPGVAYSYSTVGSRLVAGGLSLNTKGEHLGQLNVVMEDRGDEEGETATAERLRRRFETIPDLEAKLGKPTYFSLKTPVEVILYGESLELLRDASIDFERSLRTIPGLVDVRSSLEEGSPEIQILFDRDRLAALGLDMRALSETLRDRIQGAVPTRFREEDRQIDIRIRNREIDRATLDDVKNLVVSGPEQTPVRLLTLADIRVDRGPAEIHRIQQQRAAILSGNVQGRSLGPVIEEIEESLAASPPPSGVTVELGGQNREMQVSFASLRFALTLAIFLVYLVMAATFESLIHPFIVLFSIPLALVGVVAGLLATGTEISVIVLIGTVMLVGIVVNNAIVLIDKVNQLRREGFGKRDAVLRAGHIRLRPILMT
ncbi:MAG: MMPL family transporter, partial [Candidatus Eisenbacteria bacterium]|nr:MMPL family transporter [Candidatus Latescibacterota bacterium]MBD3301983.1 MMPL family transporter [Candidatus Eisenbacteria bacterium]